MEDFLWDETFPGLSLVGSGVKKFLHGQTSGDILNANKNNLIRACWLSTTGKIKALLEILITNEGANLLIIAGDKDELYDGFDKVLFPLDKVRIFPGKYFRRIQKLNINESWMLSDVIFMKENDELPEAFTEIRNANKEEFNRLILRQGIISNNEDLKLANNPFEIGLLDFISLDKGCYLGQETIARLLRGCVIKQELRYWESGNIISPNQKLVDNQNNSKEDNHRIVGFIINSMRVSDNLSCGLAMIKTNYLNRNRLVTFEDSKEVRIEIPIGFKGMIKNK